MGRIFAHAPRVRCGNERRGETRLARALLKRGPMGSLARHGTLASALALLPLILAGCPESHGTVRSCEEAAHAPSGTQCEGFGACDPVGSGPCPSAPYCIGGLLQFVYPSPWACADASGDSSDGGRHGDSGPHDAGPIDAGPCAPAPPPSGAPCHSSADCDSSRFEMCYAPGASPGCGPCVPPTRTCATDADCVLGDGSTGICQSYVDPCSHPFACGAGGDLTSTRCIPRCTTDASCGEGMHCNADGTCRAQTCMEGYVCPMFTQCGDLAGGDAHGCVRQSCSVDGDCGCGGACLTGSCFDTLGACMPPAA